MVKRKYRFWRKKKLDYVRRIYKDNKGRQFFKIKDKFYRVYPNK